MASSSLGSVPPANYFQKEHDFTVVIELPHNITDVLGNGHLIVDINLVGRQFGDEVKLFLVEPKLGKVGMSPKPIVRPKGSTSLLFLLLFIGKN